MRCNPSDLTVYAAVRLLGLVWDFSQSPPNWNVIEEIDWPDAAISRTEQVGT